MQRKIPDDAFEYYVALGANRSYLDVAKRYSVSKRAITKAARRQHWKQRLEKIEHEARERADQRLTESIEEQRVRHAKMLRAMASRAVRAIQEYPLTSAMDGMKVAQMVIQLERIAAGDPTERTDVRVEEVTKQEMQKYLVRADEPGGDEIW